MRRHRISGILLAAAFSAPAIADEPASSQAGLSGAAVLDHIKVLASDAFEGRGPGTPGEERTVAYLTEEFRKAGLKPGNPDGRFVQDVPLVGFQALATSGTVRFKDSAVELKSADAWIAVSRRFVPETRISDSEVVFVGYGVVAPEYGWDDYKGLDVRGKTIVMLVNDPAVPDPKDPTRLDPAMFGGKAMTYYGRWTYKYEIAAEKGAAAALLVHETGPAGYPFTVVVGSWGRENFDLPSPDDNAGKAGVEAWLALDTAKALCKAGGQDFDALKESARRQDFKPVPLGARADFLVRNRIRRIDSRERGRPPRRVGSRPQRRARRLHGPLGPSRPRPEPRRRPDLQRRRRQRLRFRRPPGDRPRVRPAQDVPPKRSILFLAVTAEEKGLLGAKHYATRPLYPLETTLADINMDVINLWGRTRDIVSVGLGNTTLDDLLEEVARGQGRTIGGDPEPEKGSFYRSDHFEFAKQGVPALNAKSGIDFIGKPPGYGKAKRDEYTQKDYHKVTDEVKPDWDLSGAEQDMQLLIDVGHRVAQGDRYPEWKPGTEFKARREAMLKAAKKP